MNVLMDTSGFLISSAMRATNRVSSSNCSVCSFCAASSFCAVRSSKTSTAPVDRSPWTGYAETWSHNPRYASWSSDGGRARPFTSVSYSISPSGDGNTRRS